VTGGSELQNAGAELLDDLRGARALVVNESEATTLSGQREAGLAALQLARTIPTVVVTRGDRGAVAARGDRLVDVPAPSVETVDATGAGDLFVSAFVWADTRGSDLETTLRWSCLYAGLSVRTATALSGAVPLGELLDEGLARGLTPPDEVARAD
jgi:sugar/nucleoside kinase (ribokinase family)